MNTAKNTFFDGKFFRLLHRRFVQIKLLLVKSCKFCYIFYPVGFVIDNNKLSVLNKRKINRTLNYYCCIGFTPLYSSNTSDGLSLAVNRFSRITSCDAIIRSISFVERNSLSVFLSIISTCSCVSFPSFKRRSSSVSRLALACSKLQYCKTCGEQYLLQQERNFVQL